MGIDTTAVISKGTTAEDIKLALDKKYQDVELHASSQDNCYQFTFADGNDRRRIFMSCNVDPKYYNGFDGHWLSLGMWGNSVEILKYLCETFGGLIDECDSDDIGYYMLNADAYAKNSNDISELSKMKNEILSAVGYNNLSKVLEIFHKYNPANGTR